MNEDQEIEQENEEGEYDDDNGFECSRCGILIPYGQRHVSIERHVEKVNETGKDLVIEVVDAEEIVTLCMTCSNDLDSATLEKLIKAHFQKIRNRANK